MHVEVSNMLHVQSYEVALNTERDGRKSSNYRSNLSFPTSMVISMTCKILLWNPEAIAIASPYWNCNRKARHQKRDGQS